MAEELGERTEKPTANKRREARNKGQVAKSQDLAGALLLFAAVILIVIFAAPLGEAMARLMRRALTGEALTTPIGIDLAKQEIRQSAYEMLWMVGPIMVLVFILAYLVNFIQIGPLFTTDPLKPKLSNISPLKGIKRIFGIRGLMKTVINTLKLTVMVVVSKMVITAQLPQIAALPQLGAAAAFVVLGRILLELAIWLVFLLFLIALIDFAYQRWQQTKDLKMTKQQVKDERKSAEGDPEVKGRRMRMYQEVVRQQMATAVPQADVIVTNPTHFSVAIRYDKETMAAPEVTAKGADELALRIRYLASMNEVPIVQRPPLARALYWNVEVGQAVSPEHYEAIAEILAYVYRIDQRRADRLDRLPTRPAAPAREPDAVSGQPLEGVS
ncbi:MAG: flagellar biosynthetic protein FlhB [Phycisphaerales bacterium]